MGVERVAGLGQVHEDDVAELALGVVGDADLRRRPDRWSARRIRARRCRAGRRERWPRRCSGGEVAGRRIDAERRAEVKQRAGSSSRARPRSPARALRARRRSPSLSMTNGAPRRASRAARAAARRSAGRPPSAASPRSVDQALAPHRLRRVHQHHGVERRGSAASKSSGMSLTTIRSPRARASRLSARRRRAEHGGMHDGVEVGAGVRVARTTAPERRAVEGAVGATGLRRRTGRTMASRPACRGACTSRTMLVGVDDRRRPSARNSAATVDLPDGDVAGEGDVEHGLAQVRASWRRASSSTCAVSLENAV